MIYSCTIDIMQLNLEIVFNCVSLNIHLIITEVSFLGDDIMVLFSRVEAESITASRNVWNQSPTVSIQQTSRRKTSIT